MLMLTFKYKKLLYLVFITSIIICSLYSCKNKKNKEQRDDLLVSTIYNNKLLAYSTLDAPKIVIEDLVTKKIIFNKNLKEVSFTEPKIKDNIICFPYDNFNFVCYDYKTTEKLWDVKTFGRVREFQFVNNNLIIASIDNFGIIAIDYLQGKIKYELKYKDSKSSSNMSPRPIQFDKKNFYVSDWEGNTITSLKINNGEVNWQKKITEGFTNFVISEDYIFFGSNDLYKKGHIGLLQIKNGDLLYLKYS
jgi:outer membrane protein assembly factor BamB